MSSSVGGLVGIEDDDALTVGCMVEETKRLDE